MKLSDIDWDTITQPEAARLLPAARSFEQAMARKCNSGQVTETQWMTARLLEEDLLVFAKTGAKPCPLQSR